MLDRKSLLLMNICLCLDLPGIPDQFFERNANKGIYLIFKNNDIKDFY